MVKINSSPFLALSHPYYCQSKFHLLICLLIYSFTANHHSMASGNDLTDSIVSNGDLLNAALHRILKTKAETAKIKNSHFTAKLLPSDTVI